MTAKMKAMVVHEHGAPGVIKPEDIETPEAGIKEVLLKVRGCALNHLDVHVRSGIPGIKLPIILGCDVSGEVVELGPGVDNLSVGDKVLVSPGLSCGVCKECVAGDENLCRYYHILGAGRNGGYAEYVPVPAVNCFPIPEGMNFHDAASIALTFLTSWHMLVSRAKIKGNETVLVIGGSSGVGTAAIQIAKLHRCKVITTVGNEVKAEKARDLGADEIIIHSKENITDRVKKLTGKCGVEVVFEHVGPAVFEDCLASLAQGGRLVTCGATTGPKAEIDITRLFMKHQTIYGSIMGTKRELYDLLPYFSQGLLKPVVHEVLPLSEARGAHELMESRKHFGKIVLDPST